MKGIYVDRELEKKVVSYLKRREILAMVGTRQCGKTTLMKHIFRKLVKAKFISFEDRNTLDVFTNDIKLFIKNFVDGTKYLFIDEFQYAKNGGKQLKFVYDTCNTKIIISGSSAAELSVQSIKFLVGRILVFTLSPFSFKEFLKHKDKGLYDAFRNKKLSKISIKMINKLYEEYITFGGYPAVVISRTRQEKIDVLRNIFNTYLLREIKEILQISDDFKISKLIKALSLQIGSIVNYNELSSLTGFDYPELIRYLGILKKTFICLESRPFFRNKRKEIVKAPRLYFLDNGFRNIAINNFSDIDLRVDKGPLNENFAASEIFKGGYELQYWRTKAGAEVDFVVEKGGKTIPIEVKSALKGIKFTRSFRNFVSEYGPERGIILSKELLVKAAVGKSKIHFVPIFFISQFV